MANTPLMKTVILNEMIETSFGKVKIALCSYAGSGLLSVDFLGGETNPEKDRYEDEPIARFSFNPSARTLLNQGEFCAKTWEENREFVGPLLNSGLFEATDKVVRAGFAYGEVWALKGAALEQYRQAIEAQEYESQVDDEPAETPRT